MNENHRKRLESCLEKEGLPHLDDLETFDDVFPLSAGDLTDHERPFTLNLTAHYIWTHLRTLNIEASWEQVGALAREVRGELWSECYRISTNPYTIAPEIMSHILDKVLDVRKRWIDNPDSTTGKKIPEFYLK